MGQYEELFKFAAKAGALEGYLYERKKVEPLQVWANNIEQMYLSLPDDVKNDAKYEFAHVLTRILTYGSKVMDVESKTKLNKLLLNLKIW